MTKIHGNTGKKLTEEHKAKISKTMTGRKRGPYKLGKIYFRGQSFDNIQVLADYIDELDLTQQELNELKGLTNAGKNL